MLSLNSENTLSMFKNILGNSFHEFVKKIPYDGFDSKAVNYCVLHRKKKARDRCWLINARYA